MNRLVVLYDGDCAVCQRARTWLSGQATYIELEFIPLQDERLPVLFPGIEAYTLDKELCVISEQGEMYIGAAAWIMCLYALKEYRSLSIRLSTPKLLPMAKRVVHEISSHRYEISKWLRPMNPRGVVRGNSQHCTEGCPL